MSAYWWLVFLPNFSCFLSILSFCMIVGCVIGTMGFVSLKVDAYNDKDHAEANQYGYKLLKITLIPVLLFFISCFIPDKHAMLQLKAINIISELRDVDKIPQKVVDKLNTLLDEK